MIALVTLASAVALSFAYQHGAAEHEATIRQEVKEDKRSYPKIKRPDNVTEKEWKELIAGNEAENATKVTFEARAFAVAKYNAVFLAIFLFGAVILFTRLPVLLNYVLSVAGAAAGAFYLSQPKK